MLKVKVSVSFIPPFFLNKLELYFTKIMASSHIIAWQIDGETGNSSGLYFLGSEITADSNYSHEIKRCLLLGRKALANLDSILKARHYCTTKVFLVKAMVLPVAMYGCAN